MLDRPQEQIMQTWNNNDPCKVSVICATYNHEQFIGQAIDGILMQETDFPFEIIIHDDASTDNTKEIVAGYASKYPGIIKTIFQNTNTYSKGSSALLRSLLDACGEYIAICEGDDYWVDCHKLQKQICTINDIPECTIVSHNVYIRNDTQNKQPYKPYAKYNCDRYLFNDVIKEHFIPTLSILFRKSSLPINDPFYLKGIISRDIAIELILLTSGCGVHLKGKMGVYRHHDSGITKTRIGCPEDFAQHERLLEVVAEWAGSEHEKKISARKVMITLKKEFCLLKKGDIYAVIRFAYLCISRPVISLEYITSVIRYKFLNS